MLDTLIQKCGPQAFVRRLSIHGTWGDGTHKNITYVTLNLGGRHASTHAEGNGPIDATFKAILSLCGVEGALEHYEVMTKDGVGSAGAGRITVRLKHGPHMYTGIAQGHNTNVVAADACLVAINKIVKSQRRVHKARTSRISSGRISSEDEAITAVGT